MAESHLSNKPRPATCIDAVEEIETTTAASAIACPSGVFLAFCRVDPSGFLTMHGRLGWELRG